MARIKTYSASVIPDSKCEQDVVSLSSDLYSGEFVAVKAADKLAQWVVFRARLGQELAPETVAMGPSSSHIASEALISGTVFVRDTTPIPLDHVVLTFPADLYHTAKQKYEAENGLGSLQLDKIIRNGDYDRQLGYTVKVCEPVDQGLLSAHTKITVVKQPDHINRKGSVGGEEERDSSDVELEISKFLSFDATERIEFDIKPLEAPIGLDRLVPQPDRLTDVESLAFVKVEQLAKLGCFSGDVVRINNRLLRLFSFPEPNTASGAAIYVSPVALYNMDQPVKVEISKATGQKAETASEVTISRVAGPTTTDRQLQQACLSGLRTYFESARRVVKQGDVIAIPIDKIMAQTLHGEEDSMGLVMPGGEPDDVAWYKVTSLSGNNSPLECIIDPSVTKMVQSGLVTERAPSTRLKWREYLALEAYPEFEDTKLHKMLEASVGGGTWQTTLLITSTKRGTGKTTMVKSVAAKMGIHCFEIDCYNTIGDSDAKTIGALRARLDRACSISPCIVLLRHVDVLAKKSDQDGGDTGIIANLVDVFADYADKKDLIIAATVADIDQISETIRSKFKFEIGVPVPSEQERRRVFEFLTRNPLKNTKLTRDTIPFMFTPRSDVSLDNLALQSAGLTPPDLESIIELAKVKALARLSQIQGAAQNDVVVADGGLVKLTPEDFDESIGEARTKYSDSIGAPRIPNVGWEDVGGLDGVKKEILDTIEMPLKYPHLFSGGMKKRSGILFYGPPGTGKTLLAKAIATSFSLNFFSVKGPELLNMYIGESEANVRKVFQKARDAKPCVVFFDELDSVAPKRGNQGDSGGVMDRIVSQLLAELDGMSGAGGEGVFVVGATNRPDLLDEALLRPGRFDKMLYLGISDTHDKQRTIIEALTRKFTLADDVDLARVAEKCPFTFTGADFYALSSDAMLNAMTRIAGVVDQKIAQYNSKLDEPVTTRWWFQNVATTEDTTVKVNVEDFDKAQKELSPSVSAEELEHYLRVRENFEGAKEKEKEKESKLNGSQNGSAKRNKGKQKVVE